MTRSSYWVDLLDADVRQIAGKYSTRIIEAGTGPALLLLHGTGGHAENYIRNIVPLSRHFHVVALDFLWHGRSQTTGFVPEIIPALVDQVDDVMTTLGIDDAHIEGQSLGGWVAMAFALSHPSRVRRLVLTTTMGYTPAPGSIPGYVEPDWTLNLQSSLDILRDPSFDNIRVRLARIMAHPELLPDEAVLLRQALYRQPDMNRVQQEFIGHYLGGDAPRRHLITDALAKKICQPTLVYWGEKNRTPPALGQRLSELVARGEFHCAPETGHWAQFESADEHNEVIARFLTKPLEDT